MLFPSWPLTTLPKVLSTKTAIEKGGAEGQRKEEEEGEKGKKTVKGEEEAERHARCTSF